MKASGVNDHRVNRHGSMAVEQRENMTMAMQQSDAAAMVTDQREDVVLIFPTASLTDTPPPSNGSIANDHGPDGKNAQGYDHEMVNGYDHGLNDHSENLNTDGETPSGYTLQPNNHHQQENSNGMWTVNGSFVQVL